MDGKAVLQVFGYLIYLPLIWFAGNRFCGLVFSLASVRIRDQEDSQEEQTLKAGRYIGLFERLLVSIGIVLQQWELIIAVIALKTVARYQELDKQITAEYFLVGSLASLLWAVLVTWALLAFDEHLGFGLF